MSESLTKDLEGAASSVAKTVVKKTVNHNRWTTVFGLVAVVLVAGCTLFQPKIKSPFSGEKVGRALFAAEIEAELARVQALAKRGDIEFTELETIQQEVYDIANAIVSQVPGAGKVWGLASTLLLAGAAGDNFRKGREIKKRPKPTA